MGASSKTVVALTPEHVVTHRWRFEKRSRLAGGPGVPQDRFMSSTLPPADPLAEGRSAPDEASGASPEPAPHVVAALVANHRQFLAFLEKRVGCRAIAELGCLDCACGPGAGHAHVSGP
jgi:hypothetical protein